MFTGNFCFRGCYNTEHDIYVEIKVENLVSAVEVEGLGKRLQFIKQANNRWSVACSAALPVLYFEPGY